jgi:hypothetical protein
MRGLAADLLIAAGVSVAIFLLSPLVETILPGRTLALTLAIAGFLISINIRILREHLQLSDALGTELSIARIKDPILRSQAQVVLQRHRESARELQEARISFDSETSMMAAYYDVFEKEPSGSYIHATSMVNIPAVWGRALGKQALNANRKAVERGVAVKRVFLFSTDDDVRQNLQHLDDQVDAGVHVFYAFTSQLNPGLAKDFLVTGSGAVLVYHTDASGNITESVLHCSPEVAQRQRQDFESIRAAARSHTKGSPSR